MTADLRSFLDTLEKNTPELIVRVERKVEPRWEISSVQKRLQADGDLPVTVSYTHLTLPTTPYV